MSHPTYCDFKERSAEDLFCARCSYESKRKVIRTCNVQLDGYVPESLLTVEDVPCKLRGETLRTVECKVCGGILLAEVYACERHEECTMRPLRGVKQCLRCYERIEP